MMNIKIRILLVAALVLGIFAMSGGALAGFRLMADKQASVQSISEAGHVFQGTGYQEEDYSEDELDSGGATNFFWIGGGCATFQLIQLAPGGAWTAVRVEPPSSANGIVLSCAVKIEYSVSGQGKVCFAVPPGKEGKIVYWDTSKTPPVETVLESTLSGSMACAPANQNGIYALVGK